MVSDGHVCRYDAKSVTASFVGSMLYLSVYKGRVRHFDCVDNHCIVLSSVRSWWYLPMVSLAVITVIKLST